MNQDIIEAIATIANHKRVMKHCEPNVMQPLQIEEWQVKRVLYAYKLFADELNVKTTKRKEIKPK